MRSIGPALLFVLALAPAAGAQEVTAAVSRYQPFGLNDLDGQLPVLQMDGQTSTLTALADFIGNLENTGYFKRPVEIISSNEEKINAMDLIKFQMKADFLMPGSEDKAQAVPVAQQAGAAAVRR